MAVRREYIADLYRNVLGREGSEGDITGWENADSEDAVRSMFLGSPEYTSQHGGDASWQDVGGVITPTDYYAGTPDDTTRPAVPRGTTQPEPSPVAPPNTPTPTQDPLYSQVADLYTKYLGRGPQGDDISKWLSGEYGWGDKNNLAGIERGIQTSEEASRRRVANPPSTIQPYTNFQTGGNDYTAFNTGRQQDPKTSAKDAFVYWSNQAPPPPFQDKKALTNWFNTYIRPGMDALGHKVLSTNDEGFTYTNHEGTFFVDFAQNAGAAPGTMQQRLQWGATPVGGTPAGPSGPTSTTRATGTTGGTGTAAPNYQALGQIYGPPGTAGVFNGPLQQVGQDPLSQLITGGLADFLERGGTTPLGSRVNDYVMNLLEQPDTPDEGNIARRFESARELMDKGRRTMTNDTRAALANRGLLSEPGIPQGAEIGAVRRIEESIAPEFSRALRDIYTDESQRADVKQMGYLQAALGISSDQAKQFLAGIGEGTARQSALAQIALQSLGQNMAWNQFLAEFGLKRDTVLAELQNGRVDDVMQLLNSFLSLASLSRGGYVGG